MLTRANLIKALPTLLFLAFFLWMLMLGRGESPSLSQDPLVLSAQADENGVWTYSLLNPTRAGKNFAFLNTSSGENSKIKSEIFSFPTAEAKLFQKEKSVPFAEEENSAFPQYLLSVSALALAGTALTFGLFWRKQRNV